MMSVYNSCSFKTVQYHCQCKTNINYNYNLVLQYNMVCRYQNTNATKICTQRQGKIITVQINNAS